MKQYLWRSIKKEPITCEDKNQLLNDNMQDLVRLLEDIREDAVLMGVDKDCLREVAIEEVERILK